MDDMTAFERQVARRLQHHAGPVRTVDDAAIFTAVTTTRSPKWRFQPMFSATKFVVAGAIVAVFGAFLLIAQPAERGAIIAPGADSDASGVDAQLQSTRESVPWGSKRIYFTRPPGWPSPSPIRDRHVAEFGIHDVARISPAACVRPTAFADVGPTVDDLSDALMAQTGLVRSGPVDVMVGGYPAKRFAILHAYPPGCEVAGPDGHVMVWENDDGTGLGMLDGGFAIVLLAEVEGERLVFAGFTPGHGFYGPPDEMDLVRLEADADALVASIEIVDPDPFATAWVTGTVSGGTGGHVSSEETTDEGKTRSRYQWDDMRVTMSDPRLSGMISAIYDQDVYTGAAGDLGTFLVGSGSYRIENEGGTWEGPNLFLNEGASGTATVSDTSLLVGTGAYEGLSAFLVFDMSQRPGIIVGAIFPGEVPPVATFE